jgi:hypothetical protein
MPRYAPIGQKKQYAARLRRGENVADKLQTKIGVRQEARRRQGNVTSKANRARVSFATYKNRAEKGLRNLSRGEYYPYEFSGRRNELIDRVLSSKGYATWARSGKTVEGFISDWTRSKIRGETVSGASENPRKQADLGERKISHEKDMSRRSR